MSTDEQKHLQELLIIHTNNIRKLQKQAAIYALGEIPLRLENQIEHEERQQQLIRLKVLAIGASETINQHSSDLPKSINDLSTSLKDILYITDALIDYSSELSEHVLISGVQIEDLANGNDLNIYSEILLLILLGILVLLLSKSAYITLAVVGAFHFVWVLIFVFLRYIPTLKRYKKAVKYTREKLS